METIRKKASIFQILLVIMPVIILLLFLADVFLIHRFNQEEHAFVTADEAYSVSLSMGGRENSTSEWKKRDFDLYGETVDLNAQTIDVNLLNESKYEIRDWKLRIDFNEECFFNNAWCGNVEIHQNVLADEKIQTLDLRDYELDDIELDYLYDGDLLIHLYEGDYIIYYPSFKDGELPIDKGSQITTGFIIYYLDFPDLSGKRVSYSFNRKITDDYVVYALGILLIIWALLFIIYVVVYLTYRAAVKEIEMKKSGIASMSDMYAIIYIIDLVKNELIPVATDEESEKLRPKNLTASEQLRNMFEYDCQDVYQDVALEFNVFTGVTLMSAFVQAVNAAFMGIFFGAQYFRSHKNLWPCIILHALWDFNGFLVGGMLMGGGTESAINGANFAMLGMSALYVVYALFLLRNKKIKEFEG